MAVTVHQLRVGDTRPSIRGTLRRDGTAVSLSTADSVTFRMGNQDYPGQVEAAATVVDAPNGVVRYDFVAADTVTAGDFPAEFQVLWAPGETESFPNGDLDQLMVEVRQDVP